MPPNSDLQPTELLRAWSQGDESARERLIPLLYGELFRLARRYMRQERSDHTLQATALVNEAYLRLIDVNRIEWQNRTHFLALAAQMMRRILVEFARNRNRQKRGGDAVRVRIDDLGEVPEPEERDLVALSDALSVGNIRRAYEPGRRVEVLWRPQRRRDSGCIARVAGDRDA